jgi:acyl dehydratase
MAVRYFEDFRPGEVFQLGSYTVTQDAIIAFAKEFDPQYFHTDPEAAARSVFGGIVASGWHTCGIYMRLLVDALLRNTSVLAAPGIEEIRWPIPVRPGDIVTGRLTILETAVSRSRADRGRVKHLGELTNQQQQLAMSLRVTNIMARRPLPAAD